MQYFEQTVTMGEVTIISSQLYQRMSLQSFLSPFCQFGYYIANLHFY